MTIPTANDLENTFLQAGQVRKHNPKYANDSTYWEGGRCDWGGNHNLREDCQEIVKGFGKMVSLQAVEQTLKNSSNKAEFDNQKRIYLNSCDELLSKLNNNTNSSYAFNICCIWSQDNMGQNIQRVIDDAKSGIAIFKSSLNNFNYQVIEEIRQIDLEIKQIKKGMEEKQKKAMSPDTSPQEQIILLREIERDGKILEQKIAKRAQLNNIPNFDANKYVQNFIDAMKEAIEGNSRNSNSRGNNGGGGGGSGTGRGNQSPRNPNNRPNNPFTPTNSPNTNANNTNNNTNSNDNQPSNSNNQQLFLIIGAVIILFLLMNKQNHEEY